MIGPADAFMSDAFARDAASDGAGERGESPYEVVIVGLGGRRFTASSGVTFDAHCSAAAAPSFDTIVVPGGAGLRELGLGRQAAIWLAERAPRARRVVSVCTGIYGLAATGLLDGRRVATHWSAVRDVERRFPKLRVDADAVYVKDGPFYTSAGITAGIDLALALIAEDCGPRLALAVAREMVVYYKRPGDQAQFSEPLQFQLDATDRFADLAAWVQGHLRSHLTVEHMARYACMSVRQFSRVFKARFGITPAAFVEEARLAEAGRRLGSGRLSVAAVGRSVGYRSEDVFRRAFERRFGVTPAVYRERFDVRQPPFTEPPLTTRGVA